MRERGRERVRSQEDYRSTVLFTIPWIHNCLAFNRMRCNGGREIRRMDRRGGGGRGSEGEMGKKWGER